MQPTLFLPCAIGYRVAMGLLTVSDLHCARGGIAVLQGLSLTLEPGQALVLRGPNGCGKTTLLRTLAGLQPPLSGTITCPTDSMAYAAHADGLKATLSVVENLTFWASIFGQTDIEPALVAMDLHSLANRAAQNLSAGQKRRLGLARLMVTGRPLWLLDEPTVSLDTHACDLFVAMLARHLEMGGGALLATHIPIDLATAQLLDLTPYRADPNTQAPDGFDEAFL
jgi:heme exporter protein A